MYYICRDVFFMLWCITYVMMYFLCYDVLHMLWCIFYVMMYFLCYNVLHMSWCITCVMMYYICRDVFYMLWFYICHAVFYMLRCIFCIVCCRDSWYIGPIVRGETCGWLIYEPTHTYLSCLYHITHSCIHMSARHMVLDVLPRTSGVVLVYWWHYTRTFLVWCTDGSHMCIGIMSYMVVSCMIYMSYICHMFLLSVCYSTRFPQIKTPTPLWYLILS